MSPLRGKASALYHRAPLESWIIGILSGFLITAILALNIFISSLWIITIPLLILPIFFGAILSHSTCVYNQPLTFGGSFRQTIAFFRQPYNSSFSFLGSFFKSLVIFFGFMLLGTSLGFYITYLINPQINNSLDALQSVLNGETQITNETINNLLTMNNNALFLYLCIVLVPSSMFSSLVLIYFVTRNATGVYLRLNIKTSDFRFIRMVQNFVFSRFRMPMFKKYMALNWPIPVLYVIGYLSASIGFTFITKSVLQVVSMGFVGGMLLVSFFLPLYFNNAKAIYMDSGKYYSDAISYVAQLIMRSLHMGEENIEEQLKKFENILDQGNKQEEEGNEKDPPTGSN